MEKLDHFLGLGLGLGPSLVAHFGPSEAVLGHRFVKMGHPAAILGHWADFRATLANFGPLWPISKCATFEIRATENLPLSILWAIFHSTFGPLFPAKGDITGDNMGLSYLA